MIASMLSNEKRDSIVIELFIRGRKLSISLGLLHYLSLLYQKLLDYILHFSLLIKISTKQELEEIAINNLSDIDFKEYTSRCKKCTVKAYFFQE